MKFFDMKLCSLFGIKLKHYCCLAIINYMCGSSDKFCGLRIILKFK